MGSKAFSFFQVPLCRGIRGSVGSGPVTVLKRRWIGLAPYICARRFLFLSMCKITQYCLQHKI